MTEAERIRARAHDVAELAEQSAAEDLPALIATALFDERLRWLAEVGLAVNAYFPAHPNLGAFLAHLAEPEARSWCPACQAHLLGGPHFPGRHCGTCHGPCEPSR